MGAIESRILRGQIILLRVCSTIAVEWKFDKGIKEQTLSQTDIYSAAAMNVDLEIGITTIVRNWTSLPF